MFLLLCSVVVSPFGLMDVFQKKNVLETMPACPDVEALRAMLAQDSLWRTMPDLRSEACSCSKSLSRYNGSRFSSNSYLAFFSAAELCVVQTLLDEEIEVKECSGDQVKRLRLRGAGERASEYC